MVRFNSKMEAADTDSIYTENENAKGSMIKGYLFFTLTP